MDKVNIEFGIRLKYLREQKNLTGDQLGDILGVTKQSVSTYEQGKGMPKAAVIVKITEVFNVTFDYLFGIEQKASNDFKLIKLDGLTDNQCELVYKLVEEFKNK